MAKIHGGQIIARALKNEGVDKRSPSPAAAHAAEAYTRLTGRLGVAAVTAGPGVTGTMTGVATAY